MKKIFLLLITLIMNSCFVNNTPQLTYYIATDLHYLSDSLLSSENEVYIKENLTSDGRVMEYDNEIIDAFIDQINMDNPDYLMLTGDLTLNGEISSHIDLADKLKKIKKTKVLVIPGNHDILNFNAKSFYNDYFQYIDATSIEQFKEIYADFGYTGAYSYDTNTLSYIYETSDDTWAMMLDTSLYKYNMEMGMTLIGGQIENDTLSWIEENLIYAKKNNISVTTFMHHNLLIHNELFKSSYTLYNYEQVLSLLNKYNVKINFSGHLHIQSIENNHSGNNEIYDICNGSILDYGNRYGILNIYEDKYQYTSKQVNVEKYITDFSNYSFKVFYDEYYNKSLFSNEVKYKENGATVTDFIAKANCYYFDGSYKEIKKLIRKNKKTYNLIMENSSGYTKSILEVENKNQHELTVKK